jgi:uncharacterized damage-inducible protein DinB
MSAKQQFLDTYEREHAVTMKVLRAYPTDQLELRPHPRAKSARELAWVFAIETGLGEHVMNDALATGGMSGAPPEAPASLDEILAAVESGHRKLISIVRGLSEEELNGTVKFFTAPHTLGDVSRMEFLWFLLHDEIHHRGQFSVYLRMSGAKVPSIYGPSADEPWM